MNIRKETERFIIRDITENDAEDMLEMESDPEVLKFIGTPVLTSVEEVMKGIERILSQYRKNGMGRLGIESKENGELVGWTGIKIEEDIRPFSYPDLGYRLKRKHWGKGIATETGLASLEIGFNELGLEVVNAATFEEHVASKNVLTKLGFDMIEKFEFEGEMCNYFELSKEKFGRIKDGISTRQ